LPAPPDHDTLNVVCLLLVAAPVYGSRAAIGACAKTALRSLMSRFRLRRRPSRGGPTARCRWAVAGCAAFLGVAAPAVVSASLDPAAPATPAPSGTPVTPTAPGPQPPRPAGIPRQQQRAPATPTPQGDPQLPAAPPNPTAPGNTLPGGNTQPPPANAGAGQTGSAGDGGATNNGASGAPASAPASAPALPARGGYRVTGTPDALSVFAVSVDAQELFTAIASRTDLPLVVDDTVSRRLTVNLAGKPARQIVNDIASAYGLSIADVEGVTMISEGIPRSPSSYLLSDIDSIPTKYVNAANARNLLPVFLQDYVKVNSEQNAVVLSAPTEVLGKFREDIAQFDIPASQILVELLLVELTDATVEQLGLNFTWNNAGNGASVDPGAGTITFRSIGNLPQEFSANLRALQQKGKARVRANPRIATVSGRRASIFVGRQRYVVTPIEGERGGSRNFIDAVCAWRSCPTRAARARFLWMSRPRFPRFPRPIRSRACPKSPRVPPTRWSASATGKPS
jgi:hypothetical protein